MTRGPQLPSWLSKFHREVKCAATVLAVALLLSAVVNQSAQAQTFTVLHSFSGGTDGGLPSGLIRDPATNDLFSVAYEGGDLGCNYPYGCGVVFEVDASGNFAVLHNFTGGEDGRFPFASLVEDSEGNLYGTTEEGGGNGCLNNYGCGTVFALDAAGDETILYSFSGAGVDAYPAAGMARDAAGNLFGTTSDGYGEVFKVDPSGAETVLYAFTYGEDGNEPVGNLVMDANNNIYGATLEGGDVNCNHSGQYNGCGVLYRLDESGDETVLHKFHEGSGAYPRAGVILDAAGTLWGTTTSSNENYDYGTVFRLSGAHQTVLHTFAARRDGQVPEAGLVRDAEGNLYGTTTAGGKYGKGTVFKVAKNGKETVLYSFCAQQGCPDGSTPSSGVRRDAKGNLYGTTVYGGGTGCEGMGCGTVWKLTP